MGRLQTLKSTLPTLRSGLQQVAGVEATPRMRGRAAVERRARWLYLHPLCCMCEREGQVTAAVTVDHITPLWKNGADDYETNGQSLCKAHHDAKTAAEAAERLRG